VGYREIMEKRSYKNNGAPTTKTCALSTAETQPPTPEANRPETWSQVGGPTERTTIQLNNRTPPMHIEGRTGHTTPDPGKSSYTRSSNASTIPLTTTDVYTHDTSTDTIICRNGEGNTAVHILETTRHMGKMIQNQTPTKQGHDGTIENNRNSNSTKWAGPQKGDI
jgi:hypothetical protein